MYLVAHRATERGAEHVLSARLAEERSKRIAAQHSAWMAQQELAREKERRRKEMIERTQAMAAEMLAQGLRYRPTYRAIEARACRLFRVKPSEIRSNRRHREICFARQFVMYWTVRLTKLSLPQIGRLMGNRDHTTIIHGRDVYPEKRWKMGRQLRAAK